MSAVYLHILKSELPLKGKSLTPTIADDARNSTNGEFTFAVSICSSARTVILFAVGNVLRHRHKVIVMFRQIYVFFKTG